MRTYNIQSVLGMKSPIYLTSRHDGIWLVFRIELHLFHRIFVFCSIGYVNLLKNKQFLEYLFIIMLYEYSLKYTPS